jgi:putative ATP-dependent endonuclease of the OLD family
MLAEIRVTNFRSARSLVMRPGPVAALIGEPGSGKSNVLFALRALLDETFDLSTADITDGQREIAIEATLDDGRTISLAERDGAPPIAHFPVAKRSGELLSRTSGSAAHELIRDALAGASVPRIALVRGLEACADEVSGVLFAIEEPELFLPPHTHRYLYRVIRLLAKHGNQIVFTTHSPGLLNVAALEEVNLVARDELGVTTVEQLQSIEVDDAFRVLCEFDAERSELFLSRAAILVEGMTEKIALPFVFHALGHDPDREQISIVECGGKSNLPLFVEICRRARVPWVVVHDSDMRPGREPNPGEVRLNALIRRHAGAARTVVLEPDFEGISGFHAHDHKPQRAAEFLAHAKPDELPEPLVHAVQLALESARRLVLR